MSDKAGKANLTLLGIEPIYPSEKCGYIISMSKEYITLVSEFKEKPTEKVTNDLFQEYETLQKISFGYTVVEKEQFINVIRFSGSWKDIGTGNTLAD